MSDHDSTSGSPQAPDDDRLLKITASLARRAFLDARRDPGVTLAILIAAVIYVARTFAKVDDGRLISLFVAFVERTHADRKAPPSP